MQMAAGETVEEQGFLQMLMSKLEDVGRAGDLELENQNNVMF